MNGAGFLPAIAQRSQEQEEMEGKQKQPFSFLFLQKGFADIIYLFTDLCRLFRLGFSFSSLSTVHQVQDGGIPFIRRKKKVKSPTQTNLSHMFQLVT